MRDIQFITLADDIKVNQITDKGSSVTLSVYPTALYVTSIEINDEKIGLVLIPAEDIDILSQTSLSFKKPSSLSSTDMSKVIYTFITNVVTNSSRASLIFTPTNKVVSVKGAQKLVQQVVKIMLSNAGTNRYNPEEGGDIMSFLGEIVDSQNADFLLAPVEDAVQRTKEFITKNQLGKSIPASERLLSLEITDYTIYDGYLDIKIQLRTLSGETINIPLSI